MDDIDRAKALAALEQLEAEKARRRQAKIDSGEVVSVQTTVVVHPDEDEEAATARAVARHPVPDDGRTVHRELFFVFTGVPRDPDHWKEENSSPQAAEASASSEETSRPSEEPAASGPSCSEPTYVRVTIRNGDDNGDPGAIAEAYFTIEDGVVVLRDRDDKHMTSRALLKGQDPTAVARALLREAEEPKSFNHPIRYPKLGLA
jgi:pyruvate/2-oxoglutarate dehydrogenase complex dihydrolipoamide acyltransferase (E2) component